MGTAPQVRRAAMGLVFVIMLFALIAIPRARAAGPWYVAPNGNDVNPCTSLAAPCATISGALGKASDNDTIYVGAGTYTGTGWVTLEVAKPITLSGGWNSDFSRQSDFSILDGQKQHPVAYISASGTVAIDHFVIQNGKSGGVGAGGFEVFNADLIMTNCAVRDNIGSGVGGAAYVASSLTMNNCSLTGNQAILGDGGAIRVAGTVYLNNVTLHNNYAPAGGALSVSGDVSINNSTITSNTAGLSNGGAIVSYYGTTSMRNSILAGNIAYAYDGVKANNECYIESGTFSSGGYNIIGTLNACGFVTTTGDLVGINPKLGALQGLPGYRPLLSASPAINAGDPNGCKDHSDNLLPYDVRGMPRAGRCDIGTYEVGLTVMKLVSEIFDDDTATYSILLRSEEGLSTLSDLVLTDTLPISMTYIPSSLNFSNGSGIESDGIITWTGIVSGNLPTTISFGVQVTNPLIATNVVTVGWANATFNASAALGSHRSFLPLIGKSQAAPVNACPTSYLDDFSNPASGWLIDDDSYARMEYLNSEYRILTKQSGYLYLVRAPLTCGYQNYIVEVDARWASTPGSSYGLIFGLSPDYSYYYLFDINTDSQQYRVYQRTPSGFTQVIAPTANSAIKAGNATNHFKVIDTGGWFTLMINGTTLNNMLPGSLATAKGVGLVSSPYYSNPTSDARFDNFRLTVLPPFETYTQGTQAASDSPDKPSMQETDRTLRLIPAPTWK
jgi:uncharacterized repeat protein (TIGR01451 family)